MWGTGVFLLVSHAPFQRGEVSALPNFWVPHCLCIHTVMQNDQIRRRNAYMEAACFRGHRRSHPKGAYRASALQFWEFPFIMRPSSLGGAA